ncbi:lipase family protein [Cytophagales bacterium LB-30]|uniref:Lipase family protein n=1 Tax=Shiella aurantiaca TaxID=3058365 RepID=A0ABT8F8N8_9BACT|nr:hypothetical protein [Shiella aurantiaca]MDN4166748.1 lipase family protein [Shiella aurantiaca]
MKKLLSHPLCLIAFSVLLFSCDSGEDTVDPSADNEYLVSAELISSQTQAELDTYLESIGFGAFATLTSSDVEAYKVVYNTVDTDGNAITASGAMIIPTDPGLYAVHSYQHGTLVDKAQAPSNYVINTEATTVATAFASIGYVMAVPDYLGYGETENMDHPFVHANSLARASHDMLKAVYEFVEDKELSVSDKLYLSGYSEGGFATMALLKYIEENSDLVVTKCAPGAGPYNITGFAEFIADQNVEMNFLPYYLWVLDTYNELYDLGKDWNYFLTPANAALVESGGYFAEGLNLNPQELFTAELLSDLKNGTFPALSAALEANNLYDWSPVTPIELWHGTTDDFVPYFHSEDAFEAMSANGATITLKPVVGGDHFSTPGSYFAGIYTFFRF